ncbi:class I SAM-dependent methyltransferase [Verrucomicrobium sp. 3C]|uniref:class I SAM-dependent methyltransferase n=1 Tax=Verrucomicrobium sp. 3C TaxID=1134055 RepID=UPI00037CAF4B|nr:class I SAM-dependent methyltransferase [Verrucomicrobium sp. 3C]
MASKNPPRSRRVRCYTAWDLWSRRISTGFDLLQQGLWLGLLDDRHFDELGPLQYARWAKYSDERYNLSGLQPWEERALSTYFRSGSSLLVAAAGGGREPVALARLGYRVDGFDCTPQLVEGYRRLMAREQLPGNVYLAEAGTVPDEVDPRYDGLLVGWGGYMHIPGRKSRVDFLRSLRRRVEVGTPLLLSFFCRGERSQRHAWIYALARSIRRLRRSPDPVEPGDALAGTFDHWFTEPEIRAELAEGGFALIEYREVPYGHAVGRAV